jgi:hypothetical protein
MSAFWDIVSQKQTDVSEVLTAAIIKAVALSFYHTTRPQFSFSPQ